MVKPRLDNPNWIGPDNNPMDDDPGGDKETDSSEFSVGEVVGEVLQIVVPAIILALIIHLFLAQATVVYGHSMQPNLNPSERLVIEKVSYYFDAPARNDIVVLDLPQTPDLLIKRVVGLPGETIELRDGILFVDGEAMPEMSEPTDGQSDYGPVTLRPMTYFVMGDNRSNSNDSRSFGPVTGDTIVGRTWLRYWPLDRFTFFE